MIEQEKEHVLIEYEKGNLKNDPNLPAWIMAGGMFLASIIVSGAVLFSSNIVAKSINNSLGKVTTQAAGAQVAAAPGQPSAPTGPVNVASRSDEPFLGNKNAKVTVIEFADFQCPYCKQFYQNTFDQIKKAYIDTGKIKYVFRHYPLTQIHVNAQIAGVAAECANQQGKFWDYHNLLYTSGQSDGAGLDKASLEKYAEGLGLNKGTLGFGKNKFNQCLENNSTLKTVQADLAEGIKAGVTGTPSFYINGAQIVGAQPFSAFQAAIDSALSK